MQLIPNHIEEYTTPTVEEITVHCENSWCINPASPGGIDGWESGENIDGEI